MDKSYRKSLTFGEAAKTATKAFTTLVKPVGSACNLRCSYCYYLDKSRLYEREPVMSDELLREYVRQYIEANDVPEVTFCWHGGEPLLAGKDFYRKALRYQRKYANGKRIENTLQTNGMLIDDEWCGLFRDNGFLIGISIDGPKDIHDAYRKNATGRPSFDRVMQSVERMVRHRVEFNTLSVVNRLSEGRGGEVYEFLRSIGSRYMQFLPAVEYLSDTTPPRILSPFESGSGYPAPWSVSAEGFGQFLIDIFEIWRKRDVGTYFVQMFDVALAQWYGVKPGLCAFAKSCGDGLAVEHNGDVYACDHFVYPEFLLGNIRTDHLRTLYGSHRQFKFGIDKRNALPESCTRCRYYFACTGGCPKHRFGADARSGLHGTNCLCTGYKMFFEHVEPYMVYMCDLLDKRLPPAGVMEYTAPGREGRKR